MKLLIFFKNNLIFFLIMYSLKGVKMMKIAVTGAAGRMGSGIIKQVLEQDNMEVVAAIEIANSPIESKDIGEVIGVGKIGVKITGADKLEETLKDSGAECLVDFTIANASFETIKIAAKNGVNLVVGTTGFSDEQLENIAKIVAENDIKAVISPNMATGVNVFFKVLGDLAPILDNYDIEIIEAHHKHKKDAPSGTAVKAFEIIADSLERNHDVAVHGRSGLVGERTEKEIGIHAVRGGDIVGDHTVIFAGEGERLEVTHKAGTRDAFINGVIRALNYIPNAEKGKISNTFDVLGI